MTVGCYVRSATALVRLCPDRTIVLVDGHLHDLVGPAVDVWELLGESLSIEQVVGRLDMTYSNVPAQEVEALLRRLADSGVIEHLDRDEDP